MAAGKKKVGIISQILHPETHKATAMNETDRGGRSKRNERLIARYYYYTVINKKTVNDVLYALSVEFDLGTEYIGSLLEKNVNAIKELRNKSPKIKWFNDRWPWLKW